jgi:hypothetical protein
VTRGKGPGQISPPGSTFDTCHLTLFTRKEQRRPKQPFVPFASALRYSKFAGRRWCPVARVMRYGLLVDESGLLLLELDESGEELLLPLLEPEGDSAPPVAEPPLTPK